MRSIEVYKAESKVVKEVVESGTGSQTRYREESVRKTTMTLQFTGKFHQWAVPPSEYAKDEVALSAVIEKEDGSVVHVDSTLIKFRS